jgi:hypothetical protein
MHSFNHTFGATLTLPVLGKQKAKRARRRLNLGHRTYPTRYRVNFHMLTLIQPLPDGYPKIVNHLTRLDIPSIIIISPFTVILSFNQIFGPIRTLPVLVRGKWRNNKKRNKPGGDRTSDIEPSWQDIVSIFTWLRLSDDWKPSHMTRYTINHDNISVHWDIFIQLYLWPNSNSGSARAWAGTVKNKQTKEIK